MSKIKDRVYAHIKNADMTSMVDVVFLLLIFFIMIPFKSQKDKLDQLLPVDPINEFQMDLMQKETLTILLTHKGGVRGFSDGDDVEISFDGHSMDSFSELEATLKNYGEVLGHMEEKKIILIRCSDQIPFVYVNKVISLSKKAGFTKVNFKSME